MRTDTPTPMRPGEVGSPQRLQLLLLMYAFPGGLTRAELATFSRIPVPELVAALEGLQRSERAECLGRGPGATWRCTQGAPR